MVLHLCQQWQQHLAKPSTRYQQAMDLIDDATRESEICWNQLLGEK